MQIYNYLGWYGSNYQMHLNPNLWNNQLRHKYDIDLSKVDWLINFVEYFPYCPLLLNLYTCNATMFWMPICCTSWTALVIDFMNFLAVIRLVTRHRIPHKINILRRTEVKKVRSPSGSGSSCPLPQLDWDLNKHRSDAIITMTDASA